MRTTSKREIVMKILGVLFSVSLLLFYLIGIRYEPEGVRDHRFDQPVENEVRKSSHLEEDIKTMWRTVKHTDFPVSPVSSINAAGRVFATVDVIGMTTNQVFALLGHNTKSNDSGYNFPFWPADTSMIVYRFDCGNFGWQFNLKLNTNCRVTEVESKWIH